MAAAVVVWCLGVLHRVCCLQVKARLRGFCCRQLQGSGSPEPRVWGGEMAAPVLPPSQGGAYAFALCGQIATDSFSVLQDVVSFFKTNAWHGGWLHEPRSTQ